MFMKSFFILSLFLFATSTISSSLGLQKSCAKSNVALHVKVVSLQGCQVTPPTIQLVKETAEELNLQIELEQVIVSTPDEAIKHRHIGSPTIQVNGLDIDPEARGIDQFGIT